MGLSGILIASCLSNLYRDIDLSIFIPKRVTKLPIKNTYKRFIMILLITLITVMPFKFITINASNYIMWVLNAIIVTIYAIVIAIIIGVIFDKKAFKSMLDRIKYMVVKRKNGVVQ